MTDGQTNLLALPAQHYLVTGAGSGIGRAIATLFASLGARISLLDLDDRALAETITGLPNGPHLPHVFDLSNVDAIDTIVKSVVSQNGALHGIVHAAGVQKAMPARNIKSSDWRSILAVNTEAALALGRNMTRKRVRAEGAGALIFISSIMALAGGAGSAAYSMSKAALHGLARSLAVELAPIGIRVNCIVPGYVRTPMFDRLERSWEPGQRDAIEALHPLGLGEPSDVANAAAFLAAPTGRWITGTALVVDGGYLAR